MKLKRERVQLPLKKKKEMRHFIPEIGVVRNETIGTSITYQELLNGF